MRIVLVLMALAGCAMAPAPDVRARHDPFGAPGAAVAGLGGTARLGDVSVRPLAIIEDSRCPAGVQCVWAGRLRLRVAISGVPGEPELVLGEPFALPRGGAITLTAAAPAPRHNPPPGAGANARPRFAFIRTGR
jgi:hypothetical protein